MSQNRQSEEDRENASHNYQVTLQAAQQLELLHEKLDAEYSKKLDELTALIKQQQQTAKEVKVVFVPVSPEYNFNRQMEIVADIPVLNTQPQSTVLVNILNAQSIASDLNLDDVQVAIKN